MTMNDVDLKLVGDQELLRMFKGLDQKVSHKVLKKVISDAATPMVREAKKAIPVRTTKLAPRSVMAGKKRGGRRQWHPAGLGKKSPMKKMGTSKTSATVFVGPRAGEKGTRTDTYYLRFLEEGTKKMAGRWIFKRTYESNRRTVDNNIFNSMRKILEREIRKHVKTR